MSRRIASLAAAFGMLFAVGLAGSAAAAPKPLTTSIDVQLEMLMEPKHGDTARLVVGPGTTEIRVTNPDAAAHWPMSLDWRIADFGPDEYWEQDPPKDLCSGVLSLAVEFTLPCSFEGVDNGTPPERLVLDIDRTPANSGYRSTVMDVVIEWDAAATSPVATLDMSHFQVNVSNHWRKLAVRRGSAVTLSTSHPGLFTRGPWGPGFSLSLKVLYGWRCSGDAGGRTLVMGKECRSTAMKPLPLRVSSDGMRATVTFPRSPRPRPAGWNKYWFEEIRFTSDFNGANRPRRAPGSFGIDYETTLK